MFSRFLPFCSLLSPQMPRRMSPCRRRNMLTRRPPPTCRSPWARTGGARSASRCRSRGRPPTMSRSRLARIRIRTACCPPAGALGQRTSTSVASGRHWDNGHPVRCRRKEWDNGHPRPLPQWRGASPYRYGTTARRSGLPWRASSLRRTVSQQSPASCAD